MPGKSFLLTKRLTSIKWDKLQLFQQDKNTRGHVNQWHGSCSL